MRESSFLISTYRLIEVLGLRFRLFFDTALRISLLGYDAITAIGSKRGRARLSVDQLVGQVIYTGIDALAIVGIIALSSGLIISLQTIINMPELGVGEYFGKIMVLAIVRELGPLITSLIIIGRSGAALSAYIGNMQVTREISALEVMGIDPVHFIVVPALLGMTASMTALIVYFNIIAIFGGLLLVSLIIDANIITLLSEVFNALTIADIFLPLIKGVVFAVIIAIVSCFHGLDVSNIRMVPRAVYRSVVTSLVVTIILNLVFTFIYYATQY